MKLNLRNLWPALVLLSLAFQSSAAPASFDHFHPLFGDVLKRIVKDGLVDYAELRTDLKPLEQYLDQLAGVPERQFMKFSEKEKIAFLLNLHNAATLRLVADHYPIRSIKDIGNWFSGPFDRQIVRLMGRTFSLGDVEHVILRRNHAEPRIHFALVYAAVGSPTLRAEPYVPDRLDAQLDDQGRSFLRAKDKRNFADGNLRMLYLSKVFQWYEKDFSKKTGSLAAFVEPYLPEDLAKPVKQGSFKIVYSDFDWALNDLKARQP